MKLPIDQRSDGEAAASLLEAVLASAAPQAPPSRWRTGIGAALRWLRLVVDGPDRVEMPENLRRDAGLPPTDEPRRPEPWDRLW
ncbi:MAG: hypothetical protein IT534_00505 [Bauldia sp.]|nr:hypothetical protein [Bauldia sp.]